MPWLAGTSWRGHPYLPDNNVQGSDGNPRGDAEPDLGDPRVRERQAAYIRKVVDTLDDLDNVLYEVTNVGGNRDWDRSSSTRCPTTRGRNRSSTRSA